MEKHWKVHVEWQEELMAMKLFTYIEKNNMLVMKHDLSMVKMNNANINNLREVRELCDNICKV
jgi:hypothetical protein